MSNPLETVPPDHNGAEVPLAYRAVRGGLWVIASSYWTIGFGFAANIVLTRLLTPDAFGGFALAMFFAQLLRLQTKLGVAYAFVQHKEANGESLGTYFTLETSSALIGVLLSLLAIPILLRLGYAPLVAQISLILALSAMMEGLAGIGGTLLDKELHFGQASLIQSIVFPMSYIPAFVLALHKGGIWSLVAQNLTVNLLLLVGIWWAARKRLPHIWQIRWRFSPVLARRFLGFAATVGVGMLAGMLLTQLDNFMVGTFVGLVTLGFYDRAYRTAEWPNKLLSGLIWRSAFYTYARLQDDRVRLQKTVTMVLWLITTLGLPVALMVFITAPDLISLLYGDKWLPSTIFLRILVIYSVARPVWENASTLFVAIGKPKFTTTLTAIQVLVLALTGVPLTLRWQATGTCIAVGLAFAIGLVWIYRNVAQELPIKLAKELGVPALVSILTLLGYVAAIRLADLNGLGLLSRVIIKSLYTVLAFLILTFLTQTSATRERLSYVWKLITQTRQ